MNPLNRPDTEKQIARFSGFSEFLEEFTRFQRVLDSFNGFACRIVVDPVNLSIIAESLFDYQKNPLNRPDNEKSISGFSGFSGFLP